MPEKKKEKKKKKKKKTVKSCGDREGEMVTVRPYKLSRVHSLF